MLRIRDVFSDPGSRIQFFPSLIQDPGLTRFKNIIFLPKKLILSSKTGIFIPGSGLRIFSIPDPGPGSMGQKAPDPGSGSATLVDFNVRWCITGMN